MISRIPINITNTNDKLTWRCTKDGSFSVKSAYYLLRVMEAHDQGQSSSAIPQNKSWTMIWSLGVPNANKMLIWRACHDSLPTKLNLYKKRIVESPLCPICQLEQESVMHVLWSCVSVQVVWSLCSQKLQKGVESRKIVEVATQVVSDYSEANEKVAGVQDRPSLSVPNWSAPPLNVFKANWDVAVDKGKCKIGVGVMIRNWEGRVVASLRSPKDYFPNPHLAESYGVLKAILLCKQLELTQVIFEGNAKQVVLTLNNLNQVESSTGMIMSDAKVLLGSFER
ncbi:uncharacterized protein LOC122293808 [Carya illinoinensis]|uniref:uncharacterized protein LOC122293808 n=1 Tax=Carya illinoinensis TaxID=32201 RepID=UPI001C721317|nr:uncharacterized protein LOC122293808 [Carya illinoinensis]